MLPAPVETIDIPGMTTIPTIIEHAESLFDFVVNKRAA
jgi:hypothetical protein